MLVGYARVSTAEQDLDSQVHALKKAGVHAAALHSEHVSGAAEKLPILDKAINTLQPGDILVVQRLDRLTRKGAASLHATLARVAERGAKVRALAEPWLDPDSPFYDLLVSFAGWVAQQEAVKIRARTCEGIRAARARGRQIGRRPSLTPAQVKAAAELLQGGRLMREVAGIFKVHRSTLRRLLDAAGYEVAA